MGRRSVGRRRDRAEARSSGGEIEGEIERCGAIGVVLQDRAVRCDRRGAARSSGAVRSGACDRQTGAQGSPAMTKA